VHWSDDCGFHSCEEEGGKVKSTDCGTTVPLHPFRMIKESQNNEPKLHVPYRLCHFSDKPQPCLSF
jgi:hypothetical protein